MGTTSATASIAGEGQPSTARPAGLGVLIADKFEPAGVEAIEALGCSVGLNANLTPAALPAAVAAQNPEILIVRSTVVGEAVFEATGKLSLVIRAGAGYDNIDVAAASDRGVFVANCPGKNSIAVAELVWALILSCDRRLPDQTADLRAGTWNKKEYAKAAGLYGRTLGIVGLGGIGREVAERGKAFGMKVAVWSRSLTEKVADNLGVAYGGNLINLAKLSDVISVNVAGTEETRGLIGEKFCAALKPGAYVINTSRGSVVDAKALTRAIREKGIRAGLDVYADEPGGRAGRFTDPIVHEPGVYGTHHVGASTDQAQQAVAAEVVRIIASYIGRGEVPHCVNRAASTSANSLLTVRHLNQPGVLAHVFYTLGQARINVEEMENIIYDGAKAACARIQLDEPPGDDHLNAIRANESVLSVTVTSITPRASE